MVGETEITRKEYEQRHAHLEGRLTALELMEKEHDKKLNRIESLLERNSEHLIAVDTAGQVLLAKFGALTKDLKDAARRNMWAVGVIFTAINVSLDIIIIASRH